MTVIYWSGDLHTAEIVNSLWGVPVTGGGVGLLAHGTGRCHGEGASLSAPLMEDVARDFLSSSLLVQETRVV